MVSSTTVAATIDLVCGGENSPNLVYPLNNVEGALYAENFGSYLPSHGLKMVSVPHTDPSHLFFSYSKVSFSLTEYKK